MWRNRSSTSAVRSYPKQSFQLQKALKNGLFEFEGLRVFQDFQCLRISLFTVGFPIETSHATRPRNQQLLIYYRGSHSNKLVNHLTRLQTQTDRSSRLFRIIQNRLRFILKSTCSIDFRIETGAGVTPLRSGFQNKVLKKSLLGFHATMFDDMLR